MGLAIYDRMKICFSFELALWGLFENIIFYDLCQLPTIKLPLSDSNVNTAK
jgi:hypothetical protein